MTVPPPDPFRPPEEQPPPPVAPPYGQTPYAQPSYGQMWGSYPAARPTNGFAIASMVLGILWIYWLGSVLALVFGYIARNQIRQRGEKGDGMAIAGIVLGWVGVASFVLIIGLAILAAPRY
jgi:hypothetical protein